MIIVFFLGGLLIILSGIFIMVVGSSGRVSVTNKLGDLSGTISLVAIFIGIILVGLSALT